MANVHQVQYPHRPPWRLRGIQRQDESNDGHAQETGCTWRNQLGPIQVGKKTKINKQEKVEIEVKTTWDLRLIYEQLI